jgi:tRNA(Ile)-lysidine synthase
MPNDAHILVGVSGGVDSVVLLDALYQMIPKKNFVLHVCHFNHKLRGLSSDSDQKFVERTAKKYKLKYYTDNADVKGYAAKNSFSIEQAARILRYNFFDRIAKSLNSQYLVTAHTSDDSAETFLINLFRGSGLTGLSGIPETRRLNKKTLIARPFLVFKKEELIEYAGKRELSWQEDESNALLFYTRNKVRHELIPSLKENFNPSVIDAINRCASLLNGADEFIRENIELLATKFKYDKAKERLFMPLPFLKSFSTFVQGEIIQYLLEDKFKLNGLSLGLIDRIGALNSSDVGSTIEIARNIIALRDRNTIIISKFSKNYKFNDPIEKEGTFKADGYEIRLTRVSKDEVKFTKDGNVEYFDFDLLPRQLYLRNWEAGDIFHPLGMKGSLKLSDFFINEKLSMLDKQGTVLLATKNDIIWVCGMRGSDKFKISESSDSYLRAEFIELEKAKSEKDK